MGSATSVNGNQHKLNNLHDELDNLPDRDSEFLKKITLQNRFNSQRRKTTKKMEGKIDSKALNQEIMVTEPQKQKNVQQESGKIANVLPPLKTQRKNAENILLPIGLNTKDLKQNTNLQLSLKQQLSQNANKIIFQEISDNEENEPNMVEWEKRDLAHKRSKKFRPQRI